ncbi:MAG: DivIVA domain-containing protein [Actinobacteria bacterium]|nr:DivIVA domain-containing protein [Actinomycetota bacterium]
MSLLFLLIGVAVIGGVVVLATGRVQGSLSEPEPPAGDLPADLADVRIDQALRGYRMDQVDALVERLEAEVSARDEQLAEQQAEIDRLRAARGEFPPPHGG